MSGVYDVFVKLSMANAVSPVLAVISKEVLALEGSVKRLTGEFGMMGRAMLAVGGGLSMMAGGAILHGLDKVVEKGNDIVKIQRDMAQAGVKQNEIQDAYNKALELTAKYQNMRVSDALRMINDARGVFGDQGTAIHEADNMAGAAAFLKAYEGGKHGGSEEALFREINAAIKSGEIAGKITPEEMRSHIAELVAMKVAFGDQVKIGQYLTAQRAGGVALRNTDDDFRYGMFPALVQENGPNAGTMLMTAFNKVVAGVGNRTKSLERMYELGLLKEDQLDWDKQGIHIKGLKNPDGIKNSQAAAMNFGSWVMTTLKPLLDAKIAEKGLTDPKQKAIYESQLISGMFPDRNAAKAVTEIIQQYSKLMKDAALIKNVRRDYQSYNEGSWDYQKQAFSAQVDNFVSILGGPLLKPATEALASINSVLSSMAQWASKADPATLRMIGEGIAVLGVALVGAGAVALIAALGPAGWIAAGFIALGGVLVVFREQIAGVLQWFRDIIPSASEAAHALLAFSDALKALPGKIWEAIKGLFAGIGTPVNAGGGPGGPANMPPMGGGGGGPANMPPAAGKQSSIGTPYMSSGRHAQVADVYLDGQRVGHVIERGIAMNNRAVSGASGFDGREAWQHPEVAFG